MLNARRPSRGPVAGLGRAPAATSRRSPTSRWRSSARASARTRAPRRRPPRRCARAGLAPVTLRGEGRPGPHQRHAAHDRGRRRSRSPRPWRLVRDGRRRRARSPRRAQGHRRRLRPAHPRRAPASRARRASARNLRRLLAGSPHPRVAPRLRQGAGRLQPALHARRCTARCATRSRYVARTVDDRDERRHRQPDGVRRDRRAALRRQLPRRAGGPRRRRPRHRGRGARRHQRAAHRAAGEPARSRACPPSSPATAACSRAS